MQDGHVVRSAEEPRHRLADLPVEAAHRCVAARQFGQHDGRAELLGLVGAKGYRLQPHHAAEVPLQRVVAGVVASRTEQRVSEGHVRIAQVFREAVFRLHDPFHLLLGRALCALAAEQRAGHVEVGVQPLLFGRRALRQLVAPVAEAVYGAEQSLLFHVAQQTVEVEVVELQEEVGGHEVGEVGVVVLLVDVEQLLVLSGHDGKALAPQLAAQPIVKRLQLHGVHHVAHVYPLAVLLRQEILLQQQLLACLQLADEGLFLSGQPDGHHLRVHLVVGVAPRGVVAILPLVVGLQLLPALPLQRVVPGGTLEHAPQEGIAEGVALAGPEAVAQHAQLGDAEPADVLAQVYLLVQPFHVDAPLSGNHDGPLFLLCRSCHHDAA